MEVAVLGATGPSGLEVVKRCLANKHKVTALVRSPDKFPEDIKKHENFTAVKADIFSASSLEETFKGKSAVLSCLGIPGVLPPWGNTTLYTDSCKAMVEAMRGAGVRRLIAMTSWATSYHADTPKWIEWFLKPVLIGRQLSDMARMESYLEGEKGDIDYTTVRPAGLTDSAVTDKEIKAIPNSQWVPGSASQIARADVARFMVDTCLEKEEHKGVPVSIGIA